MTTDRRYRCRSCGRELPAWLPVARRPDAAMLLHHLGDWHPREAGPYLDRIRTEAIDTVVMEAYEVVEVDECWIPVRRSTYETAQSHGHRGTSHPSIGRT